MAGLLRWCGRWIAFIGALLTVILTWAYVDAVRTAFARFNESIATWLLSSSSWAFAFAAKPFVIGILLVVEGLIIATALSSILRVAFVVSIGGKKEQNMTLRVHDRGPWRGLVNSLGIGSSILYAAAIAFFCLGRLESGTISWWSGYWGFIGGMYLVLQILPVISRPVTAEAQEMGDILTSPAAFFTAVLLIPAIFWSRGAWPNYWEYKIWWTSLPFSVADVLLVLVQYKISRGIARVAPVP